MDSFEAILLLKNLSRRDLGLTDMEREALAMGIKALEEKTKPGVKP